MPIWAELCQMLAKSANWVEVGPHIIASRGLPKSDGTCPKWGECGQFGRDLLSFSRIRGRLSAFLAGRVRPSLAQVGPASVEVKSQVGPKVDQLWPVPTKLAPARRPEPS